MAMCCSPSSPVKNLEPAECQVVTVLGAGKPFFPPLDTPVKTRLLDSRAFASGIVYLRYEVLT
jgi:hypothetical protein